jgi:hypothetical protein
MFVILKPSIHKEFGFCSCFLFDWNYSDVLFYLLYSIPVFSEGNIVDHISAKYKLAWCCLLLIANANQMDYLRVFLDFHDCFPSQMI